MLSTLERPNRPSHRAAGHGGRGELSIALCVPLGGTAGIWGPSALASARLAVAELNRGAGMAGQSCRLLTVNAADDAPDIEATLIDLVVSGDVDAVIGMHTSAVRQRILRAVGGQIPFVYTPLYEGGEATPQVFAIGETTERQLRPAIRWLGEHRRPKRWFAVGNDYVWPRVSHRLAARYVGDGGGELLADRYLPFGMDDYSQLLDEIARLKPHAILLSLIGQDAVHFNRDFGRTGLSRDVFRLSCAIEENGLLAIGADNTEGLFVSSGYFASLASDANMAFKERYYNHFGQRAPTLNALGQSTYEGVHFMAALARRAADEEAPLLGELPSPLAFDSVRGIRYLGNAHCSHPVYLAEVGGHFFQRPLAL